MMFDEGPSSQETGSPKPRMSYLLIPRGVDQGSGAMYLYENYDEMPIQAISLNAQ